MAKERDISKLATQVAAKYNRGIDEVDELKRAVSKNSRSR